MRQWLSCKENSEDDENSDIDFLVELEPGCSLLGLGWLISRIAGAFRMLG